RRLDVSWPQGDPNAVLRAVLAEPAYRVAHAAPLVADKPPLWWLVWTWIAKHVGDLLRPLGKPFGGAFRASEGLGEVIGFALVAVALVALVYGVFRLALAFARPAERPEALVGTPIAAQLSAARWRRLAAEAAERGGYSQGIAALFGAALAALDARGVVPLDAARAPGEYRRLVRSARPRAADPFDA